MPKVNDFKHFKSLRCYCFVADYLFAVNRQRKYFLLNEAVLIDASIVFYFLVFFLIMLNSSAFA